MPPCHPPSGSHEGIHLTQCPSCKGVRTRLDLGFASSAVQEVARERRRAGGAESQPHAQHARRPPRPGTQFCEQPSPALAFLLGCDPPHPGPEHAVRGRLSSGTWPHSLLSWALGRQSAQGIAGQLLAAVTGMSWCVCSCLFAGV